MSVINSDMLDAVGVDELTGICTLAIIDDLDWKDENAHLGLLQDKLNAYLALLETGGIYEVYPDAEGRHFEIRIYFQNEIPRIAVELLTKAAAVILSAGFLLIWKVV
jgi:hypothetical protein